MNKWLFVREKEKYQKGEGFYKKEKANLKFLKEIIDEAISFNQMLKSKKKEKECS